VNRYVRKFRLHWKLLAMPVVISAAVAGWFTFGAAPVYSSSASVWVDNGASIQSSLDANVGGTGIVGPAQLESQVLGELLATPGFDVAVAKGSGLVRFLAAGGRAGGFSPKVLLSRPDPALALPTAAGDVGTGIQMTVTGPQVLTLRYDGPSPMVARSVLRSLLHQLGTADTKFGASIGTVAATYYGRKLQSATDLAQNNRGALSMYLRNHPGAGPSDPAYTALAAEVRTAAARLATVRLDSAESQTEADGPAGATMAVIDPPSASLYPVGGSSTKILGVIAGAFAGLVISITALLLLGRPLSTRRWDAEMPSFERLAWEDSTVDGDPITGAVPATVPSQYRVSIKPGSGSGQSGDVHAR
jgi:hypothetical protein